MLILGETVVALTPLTRTTLMKPKLMELAYTGTTTEEDLYKQSEAESKKTKLYVIVSVAGLLLYCGIIFYLYKKGKI